VGGDVVNTVTADLLSAEPVDWTVQTKIVKEVSEGKIVVAGTTKEDTLAAASEFIAQLQSS
ncbi:S-layer protein, partial [Candidatus Micrarchaeota archaeon]|nr:S-layer protein [Candidatus Micrarchaeota archaeon]